MLSRMKFEIEDLVVEFLDQLPAEVWTSTTTTFFDPAIGGGQFVNEIENRLRVFGHSDDNIKGRVSGCESSKLNVKYAVNKNKLVGNYEVCDFLEKDFGNMKFDVVIGNPPYQSNNGSGTISGSGPSSLWYRFVNKSINILNDDGLLAFITPDGIFRSSNGSFSDFKGEHIKYDVSYIKTTTSHFDVGQETFAWILKKCKYSGETSLDNVKIDLSKFAIIPNSNIDLYAKIISKNLTGVLDFSTAGQINPKNVSDQKNATTPFALNVNGKIKYSDDKSKVHGNHKVMIGQLAALDPVYSNDMSASPSTMRMLVKNKTEGLNLVRLLNTKTYKFMIDCIRVSGRITWAINTLPKLDLAVSWSDDDLYDYFELSSDERDCIKNAK